MNTNERVRFHTFVEELLPILSRHLGEDILEVNITEYEEYSEVLEIKHGYKIAYINIHCNSVVASAQALLDYVASGGKRAPGFITWKYL